MTNTQVSVVRCADYDQEKVFKAVCEAVDLIGGISRFVKKGQKVLLKPNMLSAKDPARGITTHPMVIEAVIELLKPLGVEIWMGDSPSGAVKGIQRYWDNTGFGALAEKTGVKMMNFEAGGNVVREINGHVLHIAKAVLEADVIINLPKFKTHGYTLYTGAIKNLYGTLPGLQKATYHKSNSHPKNFNRILTDIYEAVRPTLNIMDGILGMEGNGPSTGDKRKTELVMASGDGVALDAVAAHIMGFGDREVGAIVQCDERGLGVGRLEEIEVKGLSLDEARISDFNLPSNHLAKFVPEFIVRFLGRFIWVKPMADREKCTGCAHCAKSCPVDAIEMTDGYPVMDYKKCINCLCCNESCPESAIVQQMSWIARRIG